MKQMVKQFGSSALMIALVLGLALYCKTLTPPKPANDEKGKEMVTAVMGVALVVLALAAVDQAQGSQPAQTPSSDQ